MVVAAERRDVYSYPISSNKIRIERNASISLDARDERTVYFYKHFVPTALFYLESIEHDFSGTTRTTGHHGAVWNPVLSFAFIIR
jgi:hypothetical protein